MVPPLNARSVSNQGVCGSVGEKQKVQMGAWVLAHSHHVSHEIKQRPRGLCTGASICFHICFPRLHVCHARRCLCIELRWRQLQTEGNNETQTHILRIIDLLVYSQNNTVLTDTKLAFCLQLFVLHNSNRSCRLLFFSHCVAARGWGLS